LAAAAGGEAELDLGGGGVGIGLAHLDLPEVQHRRPVLGRGDRAGGEHAGGGEVVTQIGQDQALDLMGVLRGEGAGGAQGGDDPEPVTMRGGAVRGVVDRLGGGVGEEGGLQLRVAADVGDQQRPVGLLDVGAPARKGGEGGFGLGGGGLRF